MKRPGKKFGNGGRNIVYDIFRGKEVKKGMKGEESRKEKTAKGKKEYGRAVGD